MIVTGAGGNFGGVCARRLANEGANIALVDINTKNLPSLKKECESLGALQVEAYGVDVTKPEEVESMVMGVKNTFGAIHGLFNNAGYQGVFKSVDEYPTEDFDRVMRINVTGVFNVLKYTSKVMVEQGQGGSIVNTASCAGLGCPPCMIAYGTSKAAVCHMTKIAALDLAPHNIRVNSISPAFIGPDDGFMWKRQVQLQAESNPSGHSEYYYSNDEEVVAKQMKASVPLEHRLGKVEEVINPVLFLLSGESSYMTGVDLNISGGNVIGGARG